MPAVGETAPDFEVFSDEGKKVKLSDYQGRKVVLYFYPEDFTSGCELQACAFRDHYAEIQGKNAVVLGVSADSVMRHKEFREALHLPFNLLVDDSLALCKAWDCYGPKMVNGQESVGIIRGQYIIDENGKVVAKQTPVKATESLNQALELL